MCGDRWVTQHALPIFAQELQVQYSASFVTIFLGANDAVTEHGPDKAQYVSLDDYRANLTQLLHTVAPLLPPHAKILLITPPAVIDSARHGDRSNESAGQYARVCVELAQAENVHVLDLHTYFNTTFPDEAERKTYFVDGLHFSTKGNQELAKLLGPGRTPSTPPLYARLEQRWNDLQVGRQGKYSVERLESLDHYYRTTSYTRVVLVCVLTPLPALATTVLLECMPLRSPAEGWMANWVFWIRLTVVVCVVYTLGISQMKFIIPDLSFTLPQMLTVAAGVTTGCIGFCIMMAHLIGFPVPFMWQVGAIPIGLFTPIMLVLVLGRAPFASDSPFRPQFQRFNRYFFAYLSVFGIYPFVRVLYDLVPEFYRGLIVVVLLPLWRFAVKHFVIRAMGDLEDFIPQGVAFIVDFFGSLFLSVCMYNSGSIITSAAIIGSDIAQTLLEFHEVRMNAGEVLYLLQEQRTHQDHRHNSYHQNEQDTRDLVTLILSVTRDPKAFNVEAMKGVRLWACLAHPIPGDRVKELNALEALAIYGPDHPLSGRTLGRAHPNSRRPQLHIQRAHGIVPASVGPEDRSFASPATLGPKRLTLKHPGNQQDINMPPEKDAAAERSKELVVQGLQLLFHCEYLTLVKYVASVVPLVFVAHKSVLQQLPNVVYYPGGAGSWGLAAVANILVFSMLEVVSFVLLNMLLQRRFAFSPVYQLAFVLETQAYLVQSMLFVGVVMASPSLEVAETSMAIHMHNSSDLLSPIA
ncbi:hypothetical protein BBJ28_00000437 [Nothophytophthora sp. Chile5]|nr:hypothetical protein BBJ28_00000437 [Nothophytophthora sp. Chile5]